MTCRVIIDINSAHDTPHLSKASGMNWMAMFGGRYMCHCVVICTLDDFCSFAWGGGEALVVLAALCLRPEPGEGEELKRVP